MKKIAIVASMFNKDITDKLLAGAYLAWDQKFAHDSNPKTYWVPGAFEIPLIADKLLESYDAVVALGCVINGETKHFDYVCKAVTDGCLQVSLAKKKPVVFGVLTTCDKIQALERAGGDKGNKGFDAMLAAIHMLDLLDFDTIRGS